MKRVWDDQMGILESVVQAKDIELAKMEKEYMSDVDRLRRTYMNQIIILQKQVDSMLKKNTNLQ